MAELPTTTTAIIGAIERVLTQRGPMAEKLLAVALVEAGIDLGRDPAGTLIDLLESDELPFVLPLADDRHAYLPALLSGRVFTHRLSVAEIEYGYVEVVPDLDPLAILTDRDFLRLTDGTAVMEVFPGLDDELLAERGITDNALGEEVFLLPPGLLSTTGFKANELVGFRYSPVGLEIVRIDEDEVVDGSVLGSRLDTILAGHGDAGPEQLDIVVWTACADDAALFRTPLPPLGDVIETAGFARAGEQIAPKGFDFAGWRVGRRLASIAQIHGLDDDEALAVLATVKLFETVRTLHDAAVDAQRLGEPPEAVLDLAKAAADQVSEAATKSRQPGNEAAAADKSSGERPLVRATLDFLADPAVAEAVLVETIGAGREGAAALGLFAETLEPMARSSARPALRWLRGKAYERLGDVKAAEAAFDASQSLDPSWSLALFELARYACDRGDAERGLALLRRAGAPPDDGLVELLEHFRPPTRGGLARNQPCWCGSGRKYKQCHQNRERLPLADRAAWLYEKAGLYLADGPWRADVLDVAAIRAEFWNAPDAMYAAISDSLVTDAVLFEGGAFAEFLTERGELLPDDERLLAEQWLLVERSLYEVEAVRGGDGFTARDLRTGDRHDVREATAGRQLHSGMLICARIVPAGDTTQIFGGIEPIGLHLRDELIALLDDEPEPDELVALLSRRFAPPQLQNTEGHPLVMCEAILHGSEPSALTAVLDTIYEREDTDDTGSDLRWTERVLTHGMPRIRAMLRLQGDQLHVETNSEQRLDEVLATLTMLDPAPTIVSDIRQPADELVEAMERGGSPASTQTAADRLDRTDPAVAAALDEFVRQYEQAWLDDSIPALAGLTPRQAADDPTRRPDLIRLLDSFSSDEDRPGVMSADRLRVALGLR